MSEDASNGYDAVAEEYMAVRSMSGRAVVAEWTASLPRRCSIVDVGAGHGEPLTSALIDAGLAVSAIDAAPKMVAAFRRRFLEVEVACEAAERSRFFDRKFDAALAVGLIFLLSQGTQHELLRRMSAALEPGGRLLFSAPRRPATWNDILTGRPSSSLGAEGYGRVLACSGLRLVGEYVDEGGTHYHDAVKA